MRKGSLLVAMLFAGLLGFTATAPAHQPAIPKNVIKVGDKLRPAPGYDWLTKDEGDYRVRWVPGLRHPAIPNIIAGNKENNWHPAAGFRWANNTPGDLRVVKVGPSDEDIGKAALKALTALALHEASKPQPDDGLGEAFARELSRAGRDELINSALQDLLPGSRAVERDAIRILVIQALDGELARDRDTVVAQLRRTNQDMAEAVEVAEFLIRVSQAVEQSRR